MISDFVYYKGYWWQLITQKIIMVSVQRRIENKNGKIDKITIDLDCIYSNDVIYYPENGHYYKCLKQLDNKELAILDITGPTG